MADATDLKSGDESRAGSTPALGTNKTHSYKKDTGYCCVLFIFYWWRRGRTALPVHIVASCGLYERVSLFFLS